MDSNMVKIATFRDLPFAEMTHRVLADAGFEPFINNAHICQSRYPPAPMFEPELWIHRDQSERAIGFLKNIPEFATLFYEQTQPMQTNAWEHFWLPAIQLAALIGFVFATARYGFILLSAVL